MAKNRILKQGVEFAVGGRVCKVVKVNIREQSVNLDFSGVIETMALSDARLHFSQHVNGLETPEPIGKTTPELDWKDKGHNLNEITDFDQMQFTFLGSHDYLVSLSETGTVFLEKENGEISEQTEGYIYSSVTRYSDASGLLKFFIRIQNGRIYAI